jgi:hypothetical protein
MKVELKHGDDWVVIDYDESAHNLPGGLERLLELAIHTLATIVSKPPTYWNEGDKNE